MIYKTRLYSQKELDDSVKVLQAQALKWKGLEMRFDADILNRAVGRIGEKAFAENYPQFKQETKDLEVVKFDFFTPTHKRLETKTNVGGDYEWRPHFNVSVDHDQYLEDKYEVLVFCFCNPTQKKISIIGWNYFSVFDGHPTKKFLRQGEPAYTARGAFRFNVRNKCGMYDWESYVLRPMEELLPEFISMPEQTALI